MTFPHVDHRRLHDRGRRSWPASRVWLRLVDATQRGPRRCTARPSALGAWITLVAGLGVAVTGDIQGKIMTEVQPMKMAAAEALYETETAARRSPSSPSARSTAARRSSRSRVPCLLSFLATGSFDGEVEGINDLREQYEREVRPGPGRGVLLARRLHAEHPGHLLDLPLHDRLRHARPPLGAALVLWLTRRGPDADAHAGSAGSADRAAAAAARSATRSAGSSPRWAGSRGSCSALMTTRDGVSPGVSHGRGV